MSENDFFRFIQEWRPDWGEIENPDKNERKE